MWPVTSRQVAVIGVASSAGTHHAGQERAPGALRAAGFMDRLRTAGVTVEDRGDAPHEVFVADEMASRARNLAAVVRVARTVADAVTGALADGALPVVLGGDCTITLGVVAGAQRHDPATGLLYLDGDADLATPATTSSGVLDAMGIAHLLGLADTELARLGVDVPMPTDERSLSSATTRPTPRPSLPRSCATAPRWSDSPTIRSGPIPPAAPGRPSPRSSNTRPAWSSTSTSTRSTPATCPWPTSPTTATASPSTPPPRR
jgi:hypothetical protein